MGFAEKKVGIGLVNKLPLTIHSTLISRRENMSTVTQNKQIYTFLVRECLLEKNFHCFC